MEQVLEYTPIGVVHSEFSNSTNTPRGGAGFNTAEGVIEVRQELAAGLTDIEEFSHLYIIWAFHKVESFSLLSKPPIDNRKHGVFATRSPFRPNPIGLTTVELVRREGNMLYVRGVDMMDGTPVLDIKPFMPSAPLDQLRLGWFGAARARIEAGKQRQDVRVAVVGASAKPERYSNQAIKMLLDEGYSVVPVHPSLKSVAGVDVVDTLATVSEVDTVTLYVAPERQAGLGEAIINSGARRVIFNPGTENTELIAWLREQNLEVVEGCTLVMLRSGQF